MQTDYSEKEPPERNIWQMKEARSVPRKNTGVLEALWEWREAEAQRRNVPPFKVLRNRVLTQLAESQPATEGELARTPGLSGRCAALWRPVAAAIAEGRKRPLPDLPAPTLRGQMLDRKVLNRYDALRKWRTRTAEARCGAGDRVGERGSVGDR